MTPKRPKALKWIGDMYGDGRPVQFINDVEPRDYNEEETAQLSQEQLASARHSGLYREVPQPQKKNSAKETIANDPANHQDPADPGADSTVSEVAPESVPDAEGTGE